jgi:hypothetical protein
MSQWLRTGAPSAAVAARPARVPDLTGFLRRAGDQSSRRESVDESLFEEIRHKRTAKWPWMLLSQNHCWDCRLLKRNAIRRADVSEEASTTNP